MYHQSCHSPEQIVDKLQLSSRLLAQGLSVAEACQTLEIVPSTLYRWQSDYGGMSRLQARKLFEYSCETRNLKSVIAELQDEIRVLRLLAEGNW